MTKPSPRRVPLPEPDAIGPLPPLDDAATARRVVTYGGRTAERQTLEQLWTRADDEIVQVVRGHSLGVMRDELGDSVGSHDDEAIVAHLVHQTRLRWTRPVDAAWIGAFARARCFTGSICRLRYRRPDGGARRQGKCPDQGNIWQRG